MSYDLWGLELPSQIYIITEFTSQGKIQKKLASGSRARHRVIFDKKYAFPPKKYYFKIYLGKILQVPFFKIPDTALKL